MIFKIAFFLFINSCYADYDAPRVQTPQGTIEGFWRNSFKGRSFSAFQGIPFAKPPIGELRLEPPVPAEPWDSVLKANKRYSCVQNVLGNIQGNEDCLYLNVNVPSENINSTDNLPVVVYIHGGAFLLGTGNSIDAKYGMDSDLIIVSMNYRLGPLGFLSTEDENIPGNLGLKDQSMALRWIKENIEYFGGDKNSITLAGSSAGAASVHFHFLSPMSRGLFHRAIQHAGSVLTPWAIKEEPLRQARQLAALLECPTDSTMKMKECFKTKPAKALVEHMDKFYGYEGQPLTPFAPVIENITVGAFINQDPYKQMLSGDIHDVPLWLSTTTQEGLLVSTGLLDKLDEVNQKWTEVAHYILDYNDTLPASRREEVALKIKEYYVGKDGNISRDTFPQLTDMLTHRLMTGGCELAAKVQSKVNKSPVYYHLFGYDKGVNRDQDQFFPGTHVEGVMHTQDSLYFYGTDVVYELSPTDVKMKDICQRGLYIYASTGQPSLDSQDEWKPISAPDMTYMDLRDPNKLKVETVKSLAHLEFWTSLGIQEYDNRM